VEKRRTPFRSPGGRAILIRQHKVPKAPLCIAWIQNISTAGLGLLVTESVEIDAVLDLYFLVKGTTLRQARVLHASALGDGWLLGCVLDGPLSAEEQMAFAASGVESTSVVSTDEV
jgi:hypothetical protein